MEDFTDPSTAQPVPARPDDIIPSTEIARPQYDESNSPNGLYLQTQLSRAAPPERDEDEESVEETPSPSPTAPEQEEESTMSQQRPESAPATESLEDSVLDYLLSNKALQSPAHQTVTSHISQDPHKIPTPYPTNPQPLYSPTIPPLSTLCYIQYSPEIEAARNSSYSDRQPPLVVCPPPQPEQGRKKWYSEVKNLNTNDFLHAEAKKGHPSSPNFSDCLPDVTLLGSPTDPKATLPYLPTPRSYLAQPTYAPSYSSRGAPSTIARSSHPSWSIYSSLALQKMHVQGHRQEPSWLWRGPGRAPSAPRAQYEPQPRIKEATASAAEPGAGPAAPLLHDHLPHRVKEASQSKVHVHLKGHRQEPYASSKRPRAVLAPAVPKRHDDLPHRVKGKAREAEASADETGAALPIRERKQVIDKGKATWRPEIDRRLI